jgi:serine/threonine-protein kinase
LLCLSKDAVLAAAPGKPASGINANGTPAASGSHTFLVTHKMARGPARLISADAAALLNVFRSPVTIPAAVAKLSTAQGEDAYIILETALPFLQEMIDIKVLVDPADDAAEPSRIDVGSVVGGYSIHRVMHRLDDTTVCAARDPLGAEVCLKVVTSPAGHWTRRALTQEARVLAALRASRTVPQMIEEGISEFGAFLVTTWCPYPRVLDAVRRIRMQATDAADHSAVLSLIRNVLNAYVDLHARQILHGDVNPNNILVSDDRAVLVDFGGARFGNEPMNLPRICVNRFLEPEAAQALRTGSALPAPSEAGEQYALATVIYMMLSGRHPLADQATRLDYPDTLEHTAARTFREVGVDVPPGVQGWIARALAKHPLDRYADVEEFRTAFDRVIHQGTGRRAERMPPAVSRTDSTALRALAIETRRAVRAAVDVLARIEQPTRSINFGAAGAGYYLLRTGLLLDRPVDVELARVLLEAAEAAESNQGYYFTELGITEATVGAVSLYHGPPGPLMVRALVSAALGATGEFLMLRKCFIESFSAHGAPPDLVMGSAGHLLGLSLIDLAANTLGLACTEHAHVLDGALADALRSGAFIHPSERRYLGIAHGVAGVLFARLSSVVARRTQPPAELISALDQLAAAKITKPDNSARWPIVLGANESWTGWCHGSAGYVHLWALAFDAGCGDRFLNLAIAAGLDSWRNRNPSIAHLCCGLGGQAYAMLRLYRLTGDEVWVTRAVQLASQAAARNGKPDMRPYSLFKGSLGIALLADDLEHPDRALFPVFDVL